MDQIKKNSIENTLKIIFKAFFCIICIFFLVFMPQIVFNHNNYVLDINQYLSSNEKSKIILSLYHVETFEGGSKSRSKYLEREAILFNKNYPNVYISVTTLSPEQLVLNIKENNLADIYSFGTGVGEYLSGYLGSLDWSNALPESDKLNCMMGDKLLCLPYIKSGYFLISNENLLKYNKKIENFDKIDNNYRLQSITKDRKDIKGVSIGLGFSSSLSAITSLSATKGDYEVFDTLYKAYCNFVEGKSVSLLGTMRDMFRCKNREDKGSLSSCIYTPFSTYSDLIQYIAYVESNNSIKMQTAKLFIQHLLSTQAQSRLAGYGLLSPCKNKIYVDDPMSFYEDEISKATSISAFTPLSEIEQIRLNAINKIFV